jgi:hypothetical protein
MINSSSNNSPSQALGTVRSMLKRYQEIEESYDAATVDQQDDLTAEQDTICRSVVDILRDNTDGLDAIISALDSVSNIIECTYDHDSETGERIDEPGEYSGADIVEMICNIEIEVCEAFEAAVGLFGKETTDQSAGV